MFKSAHDVGKDDRDCSSECRFKHIERGIWAITKRSVADRQLAAYLSRLCGNFGRNRDVNGCTALHYAASCGRLELAVWLATIGHADVNLRDFESGYTPVHRAVYYGYLSIAVRLIELGGDTSILDNEDLSVIDLASIDLLPFLTLSLSVPCQAYVWGTNRNYALGTGNDSTRKHPELLEQFKNKSEPICQVSMDELHSVFVSSTGKVWSCGHGLGGRLGTGSEKSSLTPTLIKIGNDKCVYASAALNHTILLLASGTVLACGLNQHHQLGMSPYIESCSTPRQVHGHAFKSRVEGVRAAKYHSVFYTSKAVYVCGLNGGQLGIPASNPGYVQVPTHVHFNNKGANIVSLVTCTGGIVFALSNGEIFLCQNFECKKIASKMLDVTSLAAFGGSLDSKLVKEPQEELKIAVLTSSGSVSLWQQNNQKFVRCIFGMRRYVNVTSLYLTQNHLLFTTKQGQAFQGTVKNKEFDALGVADKSAFHQFLDKSKCYQVNCKKYRGIHRGVTITADPKGSTFAVIQTHPKAAMTEVPEPLPSEIPGQLSALLEESSPDDGLHDVVFVVSGQSFPAHRYILSINGSQLYDLSTTSNTIVLNDVKPWIFEQLLTYLYTGTCGFLSFQTIDSRLLKPKEDPIKMLLDLSIKYKITSLTSRLHCLKYVNGKITLKDSNLEYNFQPQLIKLNRHHCPELYDVKIKTDDGSIIEAHKCVLASRLQYFYCMLAGGWIESNTNRVLTMPFPYKQLQDLIDFLYTEQVPENVLDEDFDYTMKLLILADQLLVKSLKEACGVALCNAITLKNAPIILQLAVVYNTEQLKRSVMQFISLNLNSFLESRSLETLEVDSLKQLGAYYRSYFRIHDCRIITPFSSAPSDEEVESIPSIEWPDEFVKTEQQTPEPKPKSTKITTHIKRKPRKSSNSLSEIDDKKPEAAAAESPKVNDSKPVILSTPIKEIIHPQETIKENVFDNSQFPSLGSGKVKGQSPRTSGDKRVLFPPKLSQKERKRLISVGEDKTPHIEEIISPPKSTFKGWGVISPPAANLSTSPEDIRLDFEKLDVSQSSNFTDVIAHTQQEKTNLQRMKSKSFHLTQLEDKAMEELLVFYNAKNVFDERITIQRVLPTNVAKPTWITSHKQLGSK